MSSVPTRLRPVTQRSIGTTAFFRNRPLFQVLLDELQQLGQQNYRLLFHACSIGAEVYSLLIQHQVCGHARDYSLRVQATDLEQEFIDYAKLGRYPREVINGMSAEEQRYFELTEQAEVKPELRDAVQFLPASDFTRFESAESFDVVVLLNCLIYVPEQAQRETLDRIAAYNSKILVSSAFHRSTIKADLQRHGYEPILSRQREIHDAWLDRRNETPFVPMPGIYADWKLPAFTEVVGFEYVYCSLFKKRLEPA